MRLGWTAIAATLAQGEGTIGHRRAALNVYLTLRALLVAAGFSVLILVRANVLDITTSAIMSSFLWKGWLVFSVWSLVLLLFMARGIRANSEPREFEDKLVLFSLPVDGLAVYLSSLGTGGTLSPFYRTVYLLLAVHCYHLVPTKQPKSVRAALRQLVLVGAIPSVATSMTVYCLLTDAPPSDIGYFTEFGLQVLIASAFVLLALRNLKQSSDLESARLDLDREEILRQRLLESLEDVHALAGVQSPEVFGAQLHQLVKNLGETLGFEYCALGRYEGEVVRDTAVWIASRSQTDTRGLLAELQVDPIEDPLVATIVKQYSKTFYWSEVEDGPLPPFLHRLGLTLDQQNADLYYGILPSGSLRQIAVVPLYAKSVQSAGLSATDADARGVGYIHLINRLNSRDTSSPYRFGERDKVMLDTIGRQLSIAIENFESHQKELTQQARERATQSQEAFLHNLTFERERDTIFREILTFLNSVFDSRVGSLWFPVEDGFEEDKQARRLVLRTVVVSGGNPNTDRELEGMLRKHYFIDPNEAFIGRILQEEVSLSEIQYIPDISQGRDCWAQFMESIGTKHLVAVPVQVYPLPAPTERQPAFWQRLLAILCLRPRAETFELTPEIQEALWRFARHLAIVIEQVRLRRRNDQIETLIRDQIEAVPVEDPRRFYDRLVHMVRDVMGSESCSLFLLNQQTGKLALKATTCSAFLRLAPTGAMTRTDASSQIDNDIYTPSKDNGITVQSFNKKSAVLIYNTLQHPLANRQFMDETATEGEPRSLLAAPIIAADSQAIGVLRCTNPRPSGRVLPAFVQVDKEFMVLLAGILSRLIESAQWNEEKKHYLIKLAHEMTTPLSTAEQHVGFVEAVIQGDRRVRDPQEHVDYISDNLAYLTYLIRDIQLQFGSLGHREKYEFGKLVDLRPMIEKVKKLLLHRTRVQRAIEIRTITLDLPELHVDKMRIEQVMFNLVDNAIKYSQRGRHDIVVKYEAREEELEGHSVVRWHCIAVQNWGIGVVEGEEESIFRDYTRGSNTHYAPSGTGLGLSVSRRIVDNHGGALRLTRRQWPTVFTVYLPAELEVRGPYYENASD